MDLWLGNPISRDATTEFLSMGREGAGARHDTRRETFVAASAMRWILEKGGIRRAPRAERQRSVSSRESYLVSALVRADIIMLPAFVPLHPGASGISPVSHDPSLHDSTRKCCIELCQVETVPQKLVTFSVKGVATGGDDAQLKRWFSASGDDCGAGAYLRNARRKHREHH